MLYLRFSFQFPQCYSSWRLGMLVLTIHICNARWASSPCSSRNYSYPPVSLPLLHKRGVSEQKLCSRFLSRMFILPKVGPVVTMEYFQATATPAQTGSCLDAASKNLRFHHVFFPVHSLFVHLAFIDSDAVAPDQFISSTKGWSRYPYHQRMLSEMPPGVFPR